MSRLDNILAEAFAGKAYMQIGADPTKVAGVSDAKQQIKDLMLEIIGANDPLIPRSEMELPRNLYANVESATRYALRDKLRQRVADL